MKFKKTSLLIGATILALGIILVAPALADTPDSTPPVPQLYTLDEETGEYTPVYPPWYDPENPDAFTPPEGCPWWDSDCDGEFDWMPHWGRRGTNQDGESCGYGLGRGGCGGYGPRSGGKYQTS